MACIATDATDDTGSEVLLLGTVVLAMTDLATVLACLVLIVTERAVEGGQLTKLVALQLVLAFGDRSSLEICQLLSHVRYVNRLRYLRSR